MDLKSIARDATPPALWRAARRLVRWREPPEWEHVPGGWDEAARRCGQGWTAPGVVAAQRERWAGWRRALEGSGPPAWAQDGLPAGDIGAQNTHLVFAYALLLEWCELEARPGRFGDQKYLDEWPARFDRLVIARHRGVGVGPWNVGDGRLAPGPLIDGVPVVFYHFSGLEPLAPGLVRAAHVPRLSWAARTLLYCPYLRALARKAGELGVPAFGGAHPRSLRPWIRALRSRALFLVAGGRAI
jgi:hypothetical protein